MAEERVGWKKIFLNFSRVLVHIETFMKQKELSDVEKEAFFYSFGFCSDLALKTIAEYAFETTEKKISDEVEIIDYAFKNKIIYSKETWQEMLSYTKNISLEWASDLNKYECENKIKIIREKFYYLFLEFTAKMETLEIHDSETIFID